MKAKIVVNYNFFRTISELLKDTYNNRITLFSKRCWFIGKLW